MRRNYVTVLSVLLAMAISLSSLSACGKIGGAQGGGGNQPHTHTYGEWHTTVDATCTENGEEQRECTACDDVQTRPIEKLGHEFLTYTPAGDATCTENGTVVAQCTRCEERDIRPASEGKLGHDYDRSMYCADETEHYYACSRCGEKEEGTEEAHTIENDYECSVCGWHADGTTSLQYTDTADGLGYAVTGVSNDALTKIVIPDTHNGKPVTAVAANAFRGDSRAIGKVLEEVVFGKNITSIGSCAFCYSALKTLTIPDSVTSIESFAFFGCESMQTVTFGDCSVTLGQYAFKNCTALKTVTFGRGDIEIGQECFPFSPSLTDVVIGGGNVTVGKWAFDECPKLKSVTFGDGNIRIVTCAFIQCPVLSELKFGNGKVTIEDWAFQECGFETIDFGDGDFEIGQGGFFQCTSLTDVVFGNGNVTVGNYTFQGCEKLKTVTFGDGDVVTGTDFVWNCSALTDIEFGDGNVELGEYAFRNCALERFTAGNGNITFGYAALYNCSELKTLTVGNGDLVFEAYAVNACPNLTDVTLGEGEISFGDYAFYGCDSLQNLTFGPNISEFGAEPFGGCSSLSFNKKGGVNYLGNRAHPYTVLVGPEDKELSSVVIDDETKIVSEEAFYECGKLEHVTFGEQLKQIGRWAFKECPLLQEAVFHDGLQELGNSAFYGCKSLKTVTFGNGIRTIGEYAFDLCDAIQTVNIPSIEGWLSIRFAADQFVESSNPLSAKNATLMIGGSPITDVVIPDGVSELPSLAFAGYSKLHSLTIGKDVSKIGVAALEGCRNVASLSVAAGNPTYAAQDNCVYDKTTMTAVLGCSTSQLPNGIKTIPAHTFRYIPLPETFVIPDSVEEIGEYAFCGCGTFTDLTLGTGLKKIGSWAFSGSMASYTTLVTYHIRDLSKWCGIDFADEGANPMRWESADIYGAPHAGEAETEFTNGGRALTIPEGVTEIKDYAFWNISTQELHLPSTLKTIAPTAFGKNCNLDHYEVAEGNAVFEVRACGVVEIATGTLVLGTVPYSGAIGDGITKIGEYAFSGKIFRTVSLSSDVKEIGAHAFESCRIESLTLGSVEQIGDCAFFDNASGGEGIGTLAIPDTVTHIGDKAFYRCGISELTLGENVRHIGEDAFASNAFSRVEIPSSVTELGEGAFSCKTLNEATFGDTAWTVQDYLGNIVTPDFSDASAVAGALKQSDYVWTKME